MEKVIKKIGLGFNGSILNKKELLNIVLGTVGFFLGRVWIFNQFNPVAVSFLSLFLFKKYRLGVIGAAVCLGFISSVPIGGAVQYLISVLFLCAANVASLHKPKVITQSIYAFGACFFGALAVNIIMGFSFYELALSLLEGAFAFALTFVLKKGANVIEGSARILSGEELIGLSIITICAIRCATPF